MKPLETTPGGPWWDEDGFWFGLHTLLDPVRVPYFSAALQDIDGTDLQLLDVGSGGGFVAAGLSGWGHVTAVDRALPAVTEAHRAGISRVAAADGVRLPFADASFDAVICSEVLEHVTDPARVMAEAARVTVSGGLLLFSTPSRTVWSRVALINAAQRWRLTRVLPGDLHDWHAFLTPDELEALFDGAGWRLRRLAGIGVRARHWPRALVALALLRAGRIGYAEAGRRIELSLIGSTRLAMIGYAERRS